MTEIPSFRDLSRLTGLLKVSLGVYMALAAIGLWSGWLEIELLQRAADGSSVSDTEATANDSRQMLVGTLQLLGFVITGVMFLRWTYFSNRNARSLGATGMRFKPGWAVGWYFVPIATLWKPYQALKETFKASHPDFTQEWKHAPHPSILPLWWTVWIVSNLASQSALRSAARADTVDEFLASSWTTLVSDALSLPLGIVAMSVVAKIHPLQAEKHRRLAATAT